MSGVQGLLSRTTTEDTYLNTIGYQLVFEEATAYTERVNMAMMDALGLFVGEVTPNFQWMFKLPASGKMEKRGKNTIGGATRPYGSWQVALPLEDYSAQIAADRVEWAYTTVNEMNLALQGIQNRYSETLIFEILLKLFKNTNTTFVDERKGSLTVVPLANNDGTSFPPTIGNFTDTTDNHYLESGYVATAISDTNNPYATIYEELAEHFGDATGGENIAVLINQAEVPETEALTGFDSVPDKDIRSGDNVDIPQNFPNIPGRIIGKVNNCWVSNWRYMPANYMIGIHLDAAPPLAMRVDPPETGLPQGLALVPGSNPHRPFEGSEWTARFGLGVVNRLNGVVMELGNGGTYTIPTAYQ